MYTLKIDNRERDLIASLTTEFETQALDLGDIQLLQTGNNTPLFIIERKTLADLNASIKDGRYREQKARLKSHREKHGTRLLYIFEGPKQEGHCNNRRSVTSGTLLSCCVNTALRDGIPVQRTADLQGTIQFILRMMKNIKKWNISEISKKDLPSSNPVELEYSSTLRSKKKENLTPGVCFVRQLSTIPGISSTTAYHIKELYGCMRVLITKYLSIEDEVARKELLKDIKINGRRIGAIRSTKIYKYLCT